MITKDSPVIVAKNLSCGYLDKSIWKDANFEVKPGEFIGLLGPNGAGKSSLFSLLLGLSQPIDGDLEIFGRKPQRGNSRIGYVPQRRLIDNDSRIETLEYVRLGAFGTKLGFSLIRQAQDERIVAYQALVDVDAQNLAHKALSELSGGELQRIFLAQALVSKPDILLLDEPLANLDIRRETQLVQLIDRIVKKHNIATILIAHDINPLIPVIDRIIYIANGKLASGKPVDIVTSRSLSDLYGAPIEVLKGSNGQLAVLGIEEALHHD
ncbi:MAG TPA: ATP-binding cassette domain-containing protein [Candidatus Saccharimonadales bacterium]